MPGFDGAIAGAIPSKVGSQNSLGHTTPAKPQNPTVALGVGGSQFDTNQSFNGDWRKGAIDPQRTYESVSVLGFFSAEESHSRTAHYDPRFPLLCTRGE